MRTELGKISKAKIGQGGYQDCMWGLSLTFSMKGSEVSDFVTLENFKELVDIMKKAKVSDFAELVNTPAEITFDGNVLKSWRILEEVL